MLLVVTGALCEGVGVGWWGGVTVEVEVEGGKTFFGFGSRTFLLLGLFERYMHVQIFTVKQQTNKQTIQVPQEMDCLQLHVHVHCLSSSSPGGRGI